MRSQGDFWHLILLTGAVVIAQDEVEIYTLNLPLPPGAEVEIDDAEKLVNENLGGVDGPFDIKVDEVMASGKWQGDLSMANSFRSEKGRVFLAGDAGEKRRYLYFFKLTLTVCSPPTHSCRRSWSKFRNSRCVRSYLEARRSSKGMGRRGPSGFL